MSTPSLPCRVAISVKSAFTALMDPTRGDMVAALGETTGLRALNQLRNRLLLTKEGRQILKEKPIINSSTIDLNYLSQLPQDTFGFAYHNFLSTQDVSPDTRSEIKYIGDPQLAYVMTRYRQIHDFWHTLVDLPITVEAEIGLKYFEYFQTGLPMNGLAALFGPVGLQPEQRKVLMDVYIPWSIQCASSSKFLMQVYYEKMFESKLDNVIKELGIVRAPKVESINE
ncbi:Ubiquinone biosynthesis protein [Boothiomyces macroporosus]|uniref:4-hydroxy-3-methoxy-5-polyprenylbenzoate decarboxylase n=1 Tax=Boothiomyces macroporosus TaxID=261099 RepID=A0AAD5UK21_9FUNG|nr:Ubiquinone biosynthesis protein [Boothiomyces macroporosus]